MVPRADIVAIDQSASLLELMALFRDAGHSRLPVYGDTLDEPLGMIHIKDLMGQLYMREAGVSENAGRVGPEGRVNGDKPAVLHKAWTGKSGMVKSVAGKSGLNNINWSRLKRPVLFVPPSMPAVDLLLRMQNQHIHMALVVDEYGGTDGLVTIENLIEKIVGKIEDEHEASAAAVRIQGDPQTGLIVDARLDLHELETRLAVDFVSDDLDEDIDTVGGLIAALAGRVPVRGEILRHPLGVEFEILQADPRRIKQVRVCASSVACPGPASADGVKGAAVMEANAHVESRAESNASAPVLEPVSDLADAGRPATVTRLPVSVSSQKTGKKTARH